MRRSVSEFDWNALPSVTKVDRAAFRNAMGTIDHYVDGARFVGELARLSTDLVVGPPRAAHKNAWLPNAIAVRLSATDVLGISPGAILEVDTPFAVALVSRVLSRETTPFVRARVAPDALAGAWCAVLMHVLRGSSRHVGLVAFEAGPAERVSGAWIAHGISFAALTGVIVHADQTYPYRLLIGAHPQVPTRPFLREHLLRMGRMPLRLPLIGAEGTLTHEEFESIRVGDIWLPDVWHVEREGRSGRNGEELAGNPLVAAADFSYAWRAAITRPAEITLESVVAIESNMTMKPHDSNDALIAGLGSAPLSLRLELGSVELTAREWASLSPGSVLSTGLPIGTRVILRAGSVAVATGELVNVEGELGVRILERIT